VTAAIGARVRDAAFARLLRTGSPATAGELATDLAVPVEEVWAAIAALHGAGRIRLDARGDVAGSAGLSVAADRHEIEIDGRRFWTWCAYDILGIFGALGANGAARSSSAQSGMPVVVRFLDGLPEPTPVVVFVPDAHGCANVYEEWCPNSNFFEDAAAAEAWSRTHQVPGRLLPLAEAGVLAAREWRPLIAGLRR
jgi:alkylmercury lyase